MLMSFTLDYERMLFLDAEDFAERGIKRRYESIQAELRRYATEALEIQEVINHDATSYVVKCCGVEYVIYSPDISADEGWGRATYAFFKIVNDQLTKSNYRLYAINGGNDLGGMFLTASECDAACRSLPRPEDWPYLPTPEHPWYGQCHA